MALELRGRWWNSAWDRPHRRDIWLYLNGDSWLVCTRKGDGDEPVQEWPHHSSEADARAWVAWLIKNGGDGWKETTSLYPP